MYYILIGVINLVLCSIVIYNLSFIIKTEVIKNKIQRNRAYKKIQNLTAMCVNRKLLPSKISKLNSTIILIIMLAIFIISFLLFYSYLKILSTSIILAIPFSMFPIIVIKILFNKEKSNIIKSLPMYVINIKNHIADENNIISAIQKTIAQEPLSKYINNFKNNISRGMNAIEAFEILKKEVNIKMFDTFINACEVCYINGGNYKRVLENYINIITKENVHKESSKEKAYADILTLMIMVVLNVLVIVLFVFTNEEYVQIIRNTVIGRLILNFNAISYIIIAYLVSRIYKEE